MIQAGCIGFLSPVDAGGDMRYIFSFPADADGIKRINAISKGLIRLRSEKRSTDRGSYVSNVAFHAIPNKGMIC